MKARGGQIAEHRAAAVLPGDDVVDFKRGDVESLRQTAILANLTRTPPDCLYQRFIHEPTAMPVSS
jgi:hypothetical protein